jgi:hypothetical protein
MFDFTGGHLLDKISNVVTWSTIEQSREQSRVNAESVSLASALNGGKVAILRTENLMKIEVT